MRISSTCLVIILLSLCGSRAAMAADQDYVWWEGEAFSATNIPVPVDMKLPGNKNAEQQAKLSGGRWMTTQGPGGDEPYRISYQVEVPKDATFAFWVRKFWKHGPFKWRFDDSAWQELGKNIALADSTYLEKHWGANWVSIGDVELSKGTHTLHIEMLDKKGGGCIDCFLLIDGAFQPRGLLKPGQASGLAEDGYFAWEPPADPLSSDSPIDLRHLNEAVAGGDGFVRRDGDRFVLGNGEPVRFWMVQANLFAMNNSDVDRWARRLAKYGVNLVRMQMGGMFNAAVRNDQAALDRQLERAHYVVAALKKQGIYSYFGHLYWHTADNNQITEEIFPGFGEGKQAIALLFFSERFQTWYKDYIRKVVSPVNPYTGLSLAQEPALAFVEIQNESSLLFHTFSPERFPQSELAFIEKDFGDWLVQRYGSLDAATAAWGNEGQNKHTPDHLDQGRVGLYSAGFLGSADWAVKQRNQKRAGDQLEWMITSTHDFYAEMKADFANELGMGQLISGSNWKTADGKILGGLERYTYTATDVVLRNDYYSVDYSKGGQQRFYAIEENDTFKYHSALKAPSMPGPLAVPQIAGHPFMVTENNWTRPNRFRAEWPFLIATYAPMMGLDGWTFFALGDADWQHGMAVWDINNPTILGQFPATALIYRRGYVREADQPAVHETVAFKDAYALKGTAIHAISGKDDLWVARIGDKEGAQVGGFEVDPRAFFVGPVLQEFGDAASSVKTIDLAKYIDDEQQTIHSMTGELHWDYGTGVARVDTPSAQGASGFLGAAGRIELGDVSIESKNEYGTILVVALDGKPIRESKQLLVQTATWDKPYGFKTTPAGEYEKITDLGGYPLNVRRINASVSIATSAKQAVVLDGNGYETERSATSSSKGGRLQITLPEDAIYTLVR